MRKLIFLTGVFVFVFAIYSKPSFSQQIQSADIYMSPSTSTDFFAGSIGGYDDPADWGWLNRNMDWSIGNAVPWYSRTNDMVFSTCIDDFMQQASWKEVG